MLKEYNDRIICKKIAYIAYINEAYIIDKKIYIIFKQFISKK